MCDWIVCLVSRLYKEALVVVRCVGRVEVEKLSLWRQSGYHAMPDVMRRAATCRILLQ
jgi:hypothetical protein